MKQRTFDILAVSVVVVWSAVMVWLAYRAVRP